MVDQAVSVKCKKVEVVNVHLGVEEVPFNRGFYSVDMTFFFIVTLSLVDAPLCDPKTVTGVAVHQKKVILYGSEGNVKTFASSGNNACAAHGDSNTPKAVLQVVDPICLSAKISECHAANDPVCDLPACVCCRFNGDFNGVSGSKAVYVTLGLFTIVQLQRMVQIMIPAYDFCIPDKECQTSAEDPCALFQKIQFPTDEFFPPKQTDLNSQNNH
ncbi:MAG: hypothetical protein IKU72_03220 [Oscillospiraceae bacterium]|nr:hypothetical protein [Oscillospiraceae bacterium]